MRELSSDMEAADKIKCLLISVHAKTSKEKCLKTKGEVRKIVERRRRTPSWERAEWGPGHYVLCSSTITSWEGCAWDRVTGASSRSLACG